MGMFILGVYLGSVIATAIIDKLTEAAFNARLEREGYRKTIKDKSIPEKIIYRIENDILYFIPILNIVASSYILFTFNSFYVSRKNDCINDNEIRTKTSEEIREDEMKKQKKKEKEPTKEKNKSQLQVGPNIINKPYSQMSVEEKLEALEIEKKFLLSMNIRQESIPYNDKGAYKKNNQWIILVVFL